MAQTEAIIVEVPPGFPAQSMPVDPAERIDDNMIKIEHITEDDLTTIGRGLVTSFATAWWDIHAPAGGQLPLDKRSEYEGERLRPYLHVKGLHGVKAVVNGELAGFAGWQGPEKEHFAGAFTQTAHDAYDFPKLCSWSPEQVEKIWSDVNRESWQGEFGGYDDDRRAIMGDRPHWYLAPFWVFEKFRGRGVGRKLLAWADEQAETHNPPTPLYLEALPNAVPVYLHSGYKVPDVKDPKSVMIKNFDRSPA